jgi:hypothetical protein
VLQLPASTLLVVLSLASNPAAAQARCTWRHARLLY